MWRLQCWWPSDHHYRSLSSFLLVTHWRQAVIIQWFIIYISRFSIQFFFGHLHHPLRLPQTRAETARKPSDFQSHRNTASMNIIAMIIIMMCSSVVVCYNYRYLLQQLLWICRKSSRSIPAKTIEHLRQVPQKQRTRLDNTHRQTHESSHTCTRAFCVWTRAHHDHATSRR